MVAILFGVSAVLAFTQVVTAAAFNLTALHTGSEQPIRRAGAWEAQYPGLKQKIDAAMAATAAKPHYFWTGYYKPGPSASDPKKNGVEDHAGKVARSRGGITLELTVEGIGMPAWGANLASDAWDYASDAFALLSKGDVYVVRGEMIRGGNVWVAFEYKRLKTLKTINRIMEIKTHKARDEAPVQVWPEVNGCGGVPILEKKISCPGGSKLYYSVPGAASPPVRADTTYAKDGVIKVSGTGKAAGVAPECTEILRGEWVLEQFAKTNVCKKLSKKDGGDVMREIQKLLRSSNNRHFIQKQRLSTNKEMVTGPHLPGFLDKKILDALVLISYYEKTASQTAAILDRIDSMVSLVAGVSPGLKAAWAKETAIQQPTKVRLMKKLLEQVAQKKKEAAEGKKRAGQCGNPTKRRSLHGLIARSGGLYSSAFAVSPIRRTSLESRVQKARTSGPKAAAAPSCPLKSAPQKKTVPRSKVKTKQPPAKKPRQPAQTPAKRPPSNKKKTVPRPASRARRTPGKPKPTRRSTPKRKPKTVPKPTRRPKGKARSRKGRRK